MSLLEVSGLSKRFSGLQAVDNVSLSVDCGELLGLFGPNGAGKTTTFNLIAGNIMPDNGSISFGGEEIMSLPAARRALRGIGRTFQIVRPFRGLTVMQNLLAAMSSEPSVGDGDSDRAIALLRQVGLAERADDNAGALTLGMLKRLELARALMMSPQLLLLDEPLAGLSESEANDILQLVLTVKGETAIIMVEHNVRLALPVCDNAIVMESGAVLAYGKPDQIRRDPAVIRAYLGEEGE
jgi:branched-chain amino acid transport system ATP-binding protein